jgi:hypothetical protein
MSVHFSVNAGGVNGAQTHAGRRRGVPRMCRSHVAGYAQIAASCPSPKRSGIAG